MDPEALLELGELEVFTGIRHKVYAGTLSSNGEVGVVAGGGGNVSLLVRGVGRADDVDDDDDDDVGSKRRVVTEQLHSGWVSQVALMPRAGSQAGPLLISCANDATVVAASLPDLVPLAVSRGIHDAGIYDLALSGCSMVSGSKDGTVSHSLVGDDGVAIGIRRYVKSDDGAVVKAVAWGAEDAFAAAGNDKIVSLYDVRSPLPVLAMGNLHSRAINSLVWSPRSEFELLSVSFGGRIVVSDIRAPEAPLGVLLAHDKQDAGSKINHPALFNTGAALLTLSAAAPKALLAYSLVGGSRQAGLAYAGAIASFPTKPSALYTAPYNEGCVGKRPVGGLEALVTFASSAVVYGPVRQQRA
ncbi:uncharacterized protein AMSG_00596 [Thecamonas trahens ATCC 50062]|uniref:Uncharacterized protein n=1 Tax=Thecamonas trahens ATCC 50062 TaxID=461836 RepID=A0A0L0D9A0_THETB|nr:hypothetical protein AMSG_00596 [Thecamonas trahens ATCC 50062]KNC48815.1 hypothetical protein AMSG_00596 [Thecamonas trahens ATCC 50062]|eukprot:XP_013762866.1 hypothetical protein AMSG_00596 [Thecamonas trahens ATCC 50062]